MISSKNIDIVGDFIFSDFGLDYTRLRSQGVEIREFQSSFEAYRNQYYHEGIDKIIILNNRSNPQDLQSIPKEKLFYMIWEPYLNDPKQGKFFQYHRVYTICDDLSGKENIHRINYPCKKFMRKKSIAFDERKLCTIIFRNPVKNRLDAIAYFKSCKEDLFDFYGNCPHEFLNDPMYKGPVKGNQSSEEKYDVMMQYKFYLCFENMSLAGYISEKIFDCFAAGVVPIYMGAPNITEYIPEGCFIDMRDFDSYEALYHYMKEMTEEEYQTYIVNIKNYLKSEKSYQFSPEFIYDTLFDIANL